MVSHCNICVVDVEVGTSIGKHTLSLCMHIIERIYFHVIVEKYSYGMVSYVLLVVHTQNTLCVNGMS